MIKGVALKGGNRFSLVLGIGLGVVAAILIAVYLSGAKSDSGGGSVGGSNVPVVVATVEIPAGTKIDANMVEVKNFPQGAVLAGNFSKPEDVLNQVTTVRVVPGEQVIAGKITGTGEEIANYEGDPPLALVVSEGMRGTAVEVNSIVGAGGNIRPGDTVDVILTIKVKAGESATDTGNDQIAATILQDLKVLAIDQSIATSQAEAPEDQKEGDAAATVATLLASPSQSEVLALADACRLNFDGRIGLAVRRFGDKGRYDQRTEWPAAGEPPTCAGLFGLQFLP
jgi:pilus assembly protein CpaB